MVIIDDEQKRGKLGKATKLTPEIREKILKLYREHFFIAVVAKEIDIHRATLQKWEREQPGMLSDVTHAKETWLSNSLETLAQYATDKKTKDWRALKYLLSIADPDFNDKKWLKDEIGKTQLTQINITIAPEALKQSKEAADKLIGSKSEPEKIELNLFRPKEGKNEQKNKN